MPLSVITVHSNEDMNTFVDLPFTIHKDSPLWTPPLKNEDKALLTPGSHPVWESARRELFLALRDNRPVGRIAAIVDEKYNDFSGETCGAFGFFECRDDREAAAALVNAAREWLKQEGMTFMRGPLSPSTNYMCGLLVEGFDVPPAILMPWNPPYYATLLEGLRLRKEQDLFAWLIRRDSVQVADWLKTETARLKAENCFTFRSSGKGTLEKDIRIMFDLYRESWSGNWGFCPLSEAEERQFAKEIVPILNTDYFVLFFHNGEPAGGIVALPDMNPLLKRLNGRLGLTAPWHWLHSRAETRSGYRTLLFGIKDKYRLMGLPLLVFDLLLETMRRDAHFQWIEGSWVLEDNVAINDLLEDFSGRITKRYRIYRQDITV